MPSQHNDYQDHVDETTCYAIASEADAQVFQLLSENSSSDLQLLIARLAYAEYAVEKQEFIQFYKEHHQQLPSDQIVGAVISTFQVRNSSRLKRLQERVSTDLQKLIRKSAEALILSEYAAPLKSILDQNTQSLTSELKELIAQNTEAIQSEVKQGTQFWSTAKNLDRSSDPHPFPSTDPGYSPRLSSGKSVR